MRRARAAEGIYPLCFRFILLMLLVVGHSSAAVVGTKAPTDVEIEELLRKLNKPAIKTIESEDGDIIDCVDIYKQPAFDHPLLKNHTIEMRASFIPKVNGEGNSSSDVMAQQTWLKNGSCPEGTIPILRITKSDLLRTGSLESYGLNGGEPLNCRIEPAGAQTGARAPYYGITARINVWSSLVMTDEWSLNSIAAVNQPSLVESGWGVSPILFGDSKTRNYINWRDNGKGCYNLRCPGFIQVSKSFALGSTITPLSTYGGKQYMMRLTIYKDNVQGKWWLMYFDETIGYWPTTLFSKLQYASNVEWLGRVCDTEARGYHTTTQMGNGHWPSEGWTKSSYIRNMLVMYESTDFVAPDELDYSAPYSGCYNVNEWNPKSDQGPGFFYGGPGGPCCDGRCK